MPEEHMVSLWAGRADSSQAFKAFLLTGYTEDGDYIPSPFVRDFGIKYYDEDFREAQYYEKPSRSLRALLNGYSRDYMIIPKFIQLFGEFFPDDVNAVVVWYRFNYHGRVIINADATVKMRYMGAVPLD